MKRNLLIAGLGFGLAVTLQAQPLLKVQPSPDGKEARIEVSISKSESPALLELLDAKSGHCIKTLQAGSFSNEQTFSIGKNDNLERGNYRVRYRGGITLAFDLELALPGKEKWANPTDLAISAKNVYVLDRGIPGRLPAQRKDGTLSEEIPDLGETYLHKFSHDGMPDKSFGDRGRATVFDKPAPYHQWSNLSVAADDGGLVYLTSGAHEVLVFGNTGERTGQTIGGVDEKDPKSERHTVWAGGAALGRDRLIYILAGWMIRVYDRTKNGYEGFLYTGSFTISNNFGRSMTSDRRGSIYLITHPGNVFQKIYDTGKTIKEGYLADGNDKMYAPMGLSAGGSLVWVADRGPGPGPFWDSGGGNEIILFWDNGEKLVLLERFGSPGKTRNKPEFISPCAAVQTPDHMALWVAEDGLPNPEGPPGNARVRKFRITAASTEEVPLELK